MRKILLAVVLVLATLIVWAYRRSAAPPVVPFAKVVREPLVSSLITNAKAEPIEWTSVRAGAAGAVESVPVSRGQTVQAGAVIAVLNTAEAQAALASAEARLAQVRAELEVTQSGGRATEQHEIESSLGRVRAEQQIAQREYDSLRRLQEKSAVTAAEVNAARDRLEQIRQQIAALEQKRSILVSATDQAVARARVQDAEAAVQAARQRIALGTIRAGMAGVVYSLEARPGAYVNPGDPIANIGRLDRMRVLVYVDEPELGRVQQGMPVAITWDARPGLQWTGSVQSVPTQITALGSRQVGEVVCIVDTPNHELIPGTNVNAEIRTQKIDSALTIPREALRREANRTGVFLLQGDAVRWRPIRTGATSVTRVQVLEGLAEGDSVALPTEKPLQDSMEVQSAAR
jgi:multidrug efflux pump subunit AcrA (membrane-fusion protein)